MPVATGEAAPATETPTRTYRENLQAALYAAQSPDRSYYAPPQGHVTAPPGVWKIEAPADGSPSLVVPRGVSLDLSNVTLLLEYPKEPTTQWCGILLHSHAALTVGHIRTVGKAPDGLCVYDTIRQYHGDNGNTIAGAAGATIIEGQGAGVRLLGTYITRIKDIRFSWLSHGVVHGHSSGLVTDGVGAYSIPEGGYEALGRSRRPTDLFITDCDFDCVRGDNVIVGAVGSKDQPNSLETDDQSITGGNLFLTRCVFEGSPSRAVVARKLSMVRFDNVGLEEVGGQSMIDLDGVWGPVSAPALRINITGNRTVYGLDNKPTSARPESIFKLGYIQGLSVGDVYVRNDLGKLSVRTAPVNDYPTASSGLVVLDPGSAGELVDTRVLSPHMPPFELGVTLPDETNTGLLSEPTDKRPGVRVYADTPGQVFEGMEVGEIVVRADNVTIRNCRFTGVAGITASRGMVDATNALCKNLVVERCEFDNSLVETSPWYTGVMGHDFRLERCHIHHVNDGVGIFNSRDTAALTNCQVLGNYIHDLAYFSPSPTHSDNRTHNDCIQHQGGGRDLIKGNRLVANPSQKAGNGKDLAANPYANVGPLGSVTGQALGITPNVRDVVDLGIVENWLDYGAQSLTVTPGKYPTTGNIGYVRGNRFGGNNPMLTRGGVHAARAAVVSPGVQVDGLVDGGNVMTGGAPIEFHRVTP